MLLTPPHASMKSSPPPLNIKRMKRAYAVGKVRTLDIPDITIEPTVFEKACYYATTTRDVMTMNVFFVEVIELYGSTIVYRVAPQPLLSSLTLKSAKTILQNVETKVGEINTSAVDPFFHNEANTFQLSLMTKLF